jgi:hypothetical protein
MYIISILECEKNKGKMNELGYVKSVSYELNSFAITKNKKYAKKYSTDYEAQFEIDSLTLMEFQNKKRNLTFSYDVV